MNLLIFGDKEIKFWNIKVDPEITSISLNGKSNNFTEDNLTYFNIEHNVLSILDTSMYNIYFYQIRQQKDNTIEGLPLIGVKKLKLAENPLGIHTLIKEGMKCVVLVLESKRIAVFKLELKEENVVINKAEIVPLIVEERNDKDSLIEAKKCIKKKTLKKKKLNDANDENKKLLEGYAKLIEAQSAKIDSSVILYV